MKQWLERMRYDLASARSMLKMRKYLYVGFMCQQSIEKGLKALITSLDQEPPFIHNLRKLAFLAGIEDELEASQIDFLEQLTPFAIKARYGEYKKHLSELLSRKKAEEFIIETQRLIKWLEKRISKN